MTKEALKMAMEALEVCEQHGYIPVRLTRESITAIKEALSNDTSQERVDEIEKQRHEPVAWKLVPRDPTDEMLKAMDECSTEGYDERLYAGHAASVYMAAVDVAPAPPQRQEPEHGIKE